ncbi:RibD family protein [Clostridiaceae bacterium]|nr:RibD family protein [Clostridiaceae bacterium]
MSRAYVICHMLASLDGKIDGHFMSAPESAPAIGEYARLRSEYGCRAVVYGTTTMAEGFADGVTDELPHAGERYFQEDYAAPSDVQNYIVSIDPKGVLKWSSKYIERKNRPRAHIIEVLTEQVPNDYLAYLRSFDISYIFAGRERLDCRMLLRKLKEQFGIDRVMLAGGGLANGSFLQEHLIDELSLVLAPVAEPNASATPLFAAAGFLPKGTLSAFSLEAVQKTVGDSLWLRYRKR